MIANFSFLFCDCNLNFWGHCNTPLERPFQRYIKSPKIPKILVGKPKKQICSCLTTTYQSGQKNRNGKTSSMVLFCNVSTSDIMICATFEVFFLGGGERWVVIIILGIHYEDPSIMLYWTSSLLMGSYFDCKLLEHYNYIFNLRF